MVFHTSDQSFANSLYYSPATMEGLNEFGEHHKRLPRVECDRGGNEPGRLPEGITSERVGPTDRGAEWGAGPGRGLPAAPAQPGPGAGHAAARRAGRPGGHKVGQLVFVTTQTTTTTFLFSFPRVKNRLIALL